VRDCQRYHDLIASYIAGDISPAEMQELGAHSIECEHCRGLLELHRSFATAAPDFVDPPDEAFEAMRNRVLDQLESKRAAFHAPGRVTPGAESKPPFWRTLADWFGAHPVPAPALVVLLLAAAGLVGRWTARPSWSDHLLLRAVEQQAAKSAGLDGFWNAPFTFANVALRQTESGGLSLGFDACRHVEAQTSHSSPLAREILLATIIGSPTLGERIKAIDLAPEADDSRLQEALIYALHNDPNPAVRLQALDVLGRPPLNPAKQDALLATLRDDASVQMRLKALQVLVAQQVDSAIIRRALSAAGQNDPVTWLATEIVGGS
jgi:hypothetical protein